MQVTPLENVTTGTEIAQELRAAGYTGKIVVCTANVSQSAMTRYTSAGADAVLQKGGTRDDLLRSLVLKAAGEGEGADADRSADCVDEHALPETVEVPIAVGTVKVPIAEEIVEVLVAEETVEVPIAEACLVDMTHFVWASAPLDVATDIVKMFCVGVRTTVAWVRASFERGDHAAVRQQLHTLVGQAGAIGARQLYRTAEMPCVDIDQLEVLEEVLGKTMTMLELLADESGIEIPTHTPINMPIHIPAQSPADAIQMPGGPALTLALAPAVPTPAAAGTTGQYTCIGIEDDPFQRMLMYMMFEHKLDADMNRSVVVGKDAHECGLFVDVALGKLDTQFMPVAPAAQHPADIAVLDQNIEADGKLFLLGTDLAAQLHMRGFSGVVCIMTASGGAWREELARCPGVDLVVFKSDPETTYKAIQAAVRRKHQADSPQCGEHTKLTHDQATARATELALLRAERAEFAVAPLQLADERAQHETA